MSGTLRILVVEDSRADFLLLERHLREHGLAARCRCIASDAELDEALAEDWHVALADFNVPGMDFAATLRCIRTRQPELPLVLVSGSIGEEAAADLLNAGVSDFVLKGHLARLVPTIRRVCEEARARALLSQAQERLRLMAAVFNATQEGVAVTDADGHVLTVNAAFSTITEYGEAEVLGRSLNLLQSGRQTPDFYQALWRDLREVGFWQGEIWNRRKGGEIYPQWLTISTVKDSGGSDKFVAVFTDISRIKHATSHLEHLAHHDALTDLPNRLLLVSRLGHAAERACRQGGLGAVLFLDLDRFKAVNDTLGHRAGDELLQQVAQRVRGRLREADTVARLGGDEFVVLLEDLAAPEQAGQVAAEIVALLAAPFLLADGRHAEIGGSIGIALFPRDGNSADDLLGRADAALYRVKHGGRNGYAFHQS